MCLRPKNIHVFFDVLQHKNDNLLVFKPDWPIFDLFKWNIRAFAGWFAVFLCVVIDGGWAYGRHCKGFPRSGDFGGWQKIDGNVC